MLMLIIHMSIFVHIDPAWTFCQEENFTDIVLRKRWSRTKADMVGWSTTLSHNDLLYNQLARTYWFMKRRAAFTKWKLEFYDGISYTVWDGSESVHVQINVGNIVDIPEKREGIAYARVATFIRHQSDDDRHFAFVFFDWFTVSTRSDATLDCPVYELQCADDDFQQLYPLNYIDHSSRVHFVHVCTSTCTLEQHDMRN